MALRRVKQVAQVVGGAYCLYQGVKWLMEVTEHKHKELRDHTDDTPRLAPTGFLAERFFQNSQGLWIYKRAWVPVMKPIAVVFIAHGYGEVRASGQRMHRSCVSCFFLFLLLWSALRHSWLCDSIVGGMNTLQKL